jgi:Family of unknown function (DUF5995)
MSMLIESRQGRLLGLAVRLEERAREYEQQRDSRAVFTYTYSLITRTLADGISRTGFEDEEWITLLAETFAGFYFQALDAFDQNGTIPKAWAEVFRVLKTERTTVLEDLLFAITAHIVNDLPLALEVVGLTDAQKVSHIRDFHLVNDILGNNIKSIEENVLNRYEPILQWLDYFDRNYDQILTNYGFRISRGLAWYNAVRLLDPASAEEAKKSVERSALQLIENVRRPPLFSVRVFFRVMRFFAAVFRRWPKE